MSSDEVSRDICTTWGHLRAVTAIPEPTSSVDLASAAVEVAHSVWQDAKQSGCKIMIFAAGNRCH